MAPVRPRNPGYNRKAQYGLFAAYVATVAGAAIALVVALASVIDPVGFATLRLVAAEAVAPVARGARSVTQAVTGLDDAAASWVRAGAQNRELRTALTAARRRLVATSALEEENRQLRGILGLQRQGDPVIVVTRLLSSTSSAAKRTALIDAGRGQGVMTGQPVRSADGLIGRTLEVGPSVSRILLLSDPASIVPVRRASDGLTALATGGSAGDLDVRTLGLAQNPFKPGDLLLTSGAGGLFQPNTPVAIVVARTSNGAIARPLADAGQVDTVMVQPRYGLSTTPAAGGDPASGDATP